MTITVPSAIAIEGHYIEFTGKSPTEYGDEHFNNTKNFNRH
jgi:hypothetical protein